MKLGRRGWILLGSASLAALGGVKLFTARDEDLVTTVVRTKLGHVAIDRRELAKFATDFIELDRGRSVTFLHKLAAQFPGFFVDDAVRRRLPREFADRLTLLEREICAAFMMSTGYLTNAGKPLHYSELYDPYGSVCTNPFYRSA